MNKFKEVYRTYVAEYEVTRTIYGEINKTCYQTEVFSARDDEQAVRKARGEVRRELIHIFDAKSAKLIRLIEAIEQHREIPVR